MEIDLIIKTELLKINHLQSLGLWSPPKDLKVTEIINQLGYIQIDAIFTISRSQDTVAHTRSSNYKELDVWKFVERGELFESYAHARSVVPQSHFPYYFSARLEHREKKIWWQEHLDKYPHWPKEVLSLIEDSGPIKVGDIQVPQGFPKSSGWNSPQKRILDYLEMRGYIMGTHDRNFKLKYDLTENRIGNIPDQPYTKLERFEFFLLSSMNSVGISPIHRLLQYNYNHRQIILDGKKVTPRNIVKKKIKEGLLANIVVDGVQYVGNKNRIENLDDVDIKEVADWNVYLLSPFDNVLWSRESLLEQYGFDFKMEIYVPQKKRKYGYWVLPILWGIHFVGRVEVKLDRKTSSMKFIKWFWDRDDLPQSFWNSLLNTIERFVYFHRAQSLETGNLKKKYKLKLEKIIQK